MSDEAIPAEEAARGWRKLFPPAAWLPSYRAGWLPHDAIAGVTLAAYAVPVALAYASLAGLPPERGLYGYVIGGVCYALFGTSRQLAIGPTSAISMLVGTTVAGMAQGDAVRWGEIAALSAVVFGAMSILAWLLRLSALVSFISETILLGFKAGAAFTIAMTQLPKLFGVKGGGEHFLERTWTLLHQLGDMNLAVLAFGLVAIALLALGQKALPGKPVALAVVAASIAVLTMTSLQEHGFKVVGELPSGLPQVSAPALRPSEVDGIVPLAFACFLLAYIESVSAARTLAERRGYEIDPRQELLALGAANVGVAFGQGFPVAGGLSQSSVNDKAGAKTPLALVFASAAIAACLFFTGLVRNLPNVVLAAIVLVAVSGLVDVPSMVRLRRSSRFEFRIAMAAFVGVLLLGILKGVVLAAILSLLMLIARAARPHVAFLGRIPGTDRYSGLERSPDNEEIAGAILFRVEAGILYFNADHVRDTVWRRIRAAASPPKLVVGDLSMSAYVDVSGARMLARLHSDLAAAGIQLRLVEAHGYVRDLLRAEGLEDRVGDLDRRTSLDDVVRAIRA